MNHFKWQYPMQPSSFGMEQDKENRSEMINDSTIDKNSQTTQRNDRQTHENNMSWQQKEDISKHMHKQDDKPTSMSQEKSEARDEHIFDTWDKKDDNEIDEQEIRVQAVQSNQPIQSDEASQSIQSPQPVPRPQPSQTASQTRPPQPSQMPPQSRPMQPSQVPQPIQPVQPSMPMRPIHPTRPPMPTAPNQPVRPTQPVRPPMPPMPPMSMRPMRPVQPMQPIQPMRPPQMPKAPQPLQPVRPFQPPRPNQPMTQSAPGQSPVFIQPSNDNERENRRDISQGSVDMEMPEFNPTTLNANTGEQKLPANLNSAELGSVTLDGTGYPAETYILQYDIIPFDRFTSENQESGRLKIQAYAAQQAIPIAGVRVIVGRRFSDGDRIFFEGTTDENGLIENILLPAPSKNLSLSSGNMITSAVYDLYAELGELEPSHYTVNVYDSVETIQPIILRTLVR